MKKFLITLILCFLSNNLIAQDLIKTLSDAFKNNSKLNAQRANLKASKQDVNISRGDFLPSVTLSGDKATQKDYDRTDLSGTSLSDTNSTPESRSVLVEQKIFDGFGNYNNLKKSKLKLEYSKMELNKIEQETLLAAAQAHTGLLLNKKRSACTKFGS